MQNTNLEIRVQELEKLVKAQSHAIELLLDLYNAIFNRDEFESSEVKLTHPEGLITLERIVNEVLYT